MAVMLLEDGREANSGTVRSCTVDAHFVHLNLVIAECAKAVFVKPCAVLCDLFKIRERGAKYRLSGEHKFTGAELAELIRTDEGFKFITAIMADAPRKPAWWRICAPVMEAAEIRKMQMLAQRRVKKALETAIDADRDLSAAIARADALVVHDEDFARPYADALRSMARVPDRSVAPTEECGR